MIQKPFRIVLVNPPSFQILEPEYDTPKFGRAGLAYLAGYLRQFEGYSIEIIDAKLERLSFETTIQRILEKKPDLLGLGAFTCEIKPAAYVAKCVKARAPWIRTVIGGVHVTAIPKETLEEFLEFDIGVYGEGEVTFGELCQALKNKGELDTIPGLVFRTEGEIKLNSPRWRIPDQDTIPFPAWDLFPRAEEYFVMTQRGCPFNCLFCMNPNGRIARARSISNVMEELLLILNRYHPKRIRFGDELFSVNMDRTHELLNAMIEAGIQKRVRWHAQTHVHFVDTPLFRKMKKAGAWLVGLGIETGDAEILQQMGKGTTPQMILQATRAAKEAGLPIITYLILGHPNETRESMRKTIDLAVQINPEMPAFGIMVPYPGTEVARLAAAREGGYRIRSVDWDDYDKQIGGALEFANLSRTEVEKLQLWAYFKVFLWNLRLWDLVKFCWRYRTEGFALLKKIISERGDKLDIQQLKEGKKVQSNRLLEKKDLIHATLNWQTWQKKDLARMKQARAGADKIVFSENQAR